MGDVLEFKPKRPHRACPCGWKAPAWIRAETASSDPGTRITKLTYQCPECGATLVELGEATVHVHD